MFPIRRTLMAVAAAAGLIAGSGQVSAVAAPPSSQHYDHVFVVVLENHGYTDVIGNPAAPNLNALAKQYGSATGYYAVTHPSEPNYVAMLGGGTFGVKNDNAYFVNRVSQPSLISQLDHAGLSWKAYLQSVPHPGYQGICYPAPCNGAPDKDPLYVSKHNGILNFSSSLNAKDWSRQVPIEQLSTDLRSGAVPAFNYVIPDECHDGHGDPPYCLDAGNTGGSDPQDQRLLATGDQYLGKLVAGITAAPFWAKGNNAIDIVYDEGNDNTGGGGHVANVVVTSHGPRGLQDPASYSHYSLLQTLQHNFGLGCLAATCDTAKVKSMNPLLAVTGSKATPFQALPVPAIATPTPSPNEPVSYVTDRPASGGWAVQPAPMFGAGDNTYGAVAAVSAKDVWAVGNYLPDTTTSNHDATLSLAAHFDGKSWTYTPTPNSGPNFNTLFGVAAVPGRAWAVGVRLDKAYGAHSLIEAWDGKAWHLVTGPKLDSQRAILFSATAVSENDVWAAGEQQSASGKYSTLIEHWDGKQWSVVPGPNPGGSGNSLYGVASSGGNNVWAVGQRNDQGSDVPLVEHWDGKHWSAVQVPSGGAAGALQGVAVHGGDVWAVGQTDDSAHQARPLSLHLSQGHWTATIASGLGSGFSNINGVTLVGNTAWAAGTYYDAASDKQLTLIARNDGSGWKAVNAPNPGTGDKVLGGISAGDGLIWAVGYDKTDTGRSALIELHHSN
ncbi:MAG TPA: alkaline phosphatase family protein [Streptosporangiaceae bacterium]|nr:alkaline phosphatase family protein [Streptosporangiaceae bacterium]